MSDPEDERHSQSGELHATPVGTNEDNVMVYAYSASLYILNTTCEVQ